MLWRKIRRFWKNGSVNRNRVYKKVLVCSITAIVFCISSCSNAFSQKDNREELCGEDAKEAVSNENRKNEEKKAAEEIEKGYNLPVRDKERKEAKEDCKNVMERIFDLYKQADKGLASNTVISDETIDKMVEKVKETGYPVTATKVYTNMENYKKMERFLKDCKNGKKGTMILYELHSDGGIGRNKYTFDGTDLYVLSAIAIWNENNEPKMTEVSYTRIKKWKYTKRGWFGYELCVPEPPEVSEMVDGSILIRVKPMDEQCREMAKKCVQEIGYQGNNLLCTNWDREHMEKLDYNCLYESLYSMKYQKEFSDEQASNGIPQKDFEKLVMEYLPVTAGQIRNYAAFDADSQTYDWKKTGCFHYIPTYLGTAVPEVVDIRENKDGTVTLTVDAVCDMVVCDEAMITHELTVRFAEDGSFKYLGNKILDGRENIPEYQYRFDRK